jgi:hypothetical protein
MSDRKDNTIIKIVVIAAIVILLWKIYTKKKAITEEPVTTGPEAEEQQYGDNYANYQAEVYYSQKSNEAIRNINKKVIQFRLINTYSTKQPAQILNTTQDPGVVDGTYDTLDVFPMAFPAAHISTDGFTANWERINEGIGYRLDIAKDATFLDLIDGYADLDVGDLTTLVVSGLMVGTPYYYRVRKYGMGWLSSNSNTIQAITSSYDLHTLLPPMYIQNVERNNMNPTTETRWKIIDEDSLAQTLTFDRDLPIEISDYGTDLTKRWVVEGTPGNIFYISNVDWINRKITYSFSRGVAIIGANMCFFNCMKNFYMNPITVLITPPVWTTYNMGGTVWKHSDGTFRLHSAEWSTVGSYNTHTLYSSPDLLNWTIIGGTYKYKAGNTPFDKANWCVASTNLIFTSGRYKLPGTTNFIKLITGKDASGNFQIAPVVFDEDFNIVSIPDDPITIPGYPSGAGITMIGGNIILYHGKYYATVDYRDATGSPTHYKTLILELDKLTNPTVLSVELAIPDVISNSFMGGDYTTPTLFVWNDTLYLWVIGETNTPADTPLSGNYEVGIFEKINGVWIAYAQNPIIMNPVATENFIGTGVYPGAYWASDAMGGGFAWIQEGRNVYLFISMKSGANTYKIGRRILELPDGVNFPDYC